MEENVSVLVDVNEFQAKVLDFITSDEIDKFYNSTTFADKPECKQAMIHGMCIASLLTCQCNQTVLRRKEE